MSKNDNGLDSNIIEISHKCNDNDNDNDNDNEGCFIGTDR